MLLNSTIKFLSFAVKQNKFQYFLKCRLIFCQLTNSFELDFKRFVFKMAQRFLDVYQTDPVTCNEWFKYLEIQYHKELNQIKDVPAFEYKIKAIASIVFSVCKHFGLDNFPGKEQLAVFVFPSSQPVSSFHLILHPLLGLDCFNVGLTSACRTYSFRFLVFINLFTQRKIATVCIK